MTRKIIHIDMDAFYASVEQRDNPSLRGKPIIVGGSPDKRGVVSTASYEARKYGIKSAMPTKTAINLCPSLIIVKPDFHKYFTVSHQLIEIYREYTDIIEPLSLDECYLDVTENKKNIKTATEIGKILMERIKLELSLTASVGVAPNKLIAKIASDMNKPDGIFIVKPNRVEEFMKDLDATKLWGIGKVTGQILKKMNINTCGDLQRFTMLELIDIFGKFGETLYYYARGIDDRPVVVERISKSIGSENTFERDVNNFDLIREEVYRHTQEIVARLKEGELMAKTVTIKIKYFDFRRITRSFTLNNHTDDFNEIYAVCLNILKKINLNEKIRLVGVALSNFNNKEEADNQLKLEY